MNYLVSRRPAVNGVSTRGTTLSDFDRLFDSVFGSMEGWNDRRPAIDVRESDSAYTLDADLPGFSDDQIDVRIEGELLVVSARAEEENREEDGDRYIVRERRSRSFYRSFSLPTDADAGSIEAAYRNGVLTITLPKKPEAKPRQIQIKRK